MKKSNSIRQITVSCIVLMGSIVAAAQNGKIISQHQVRLADSMAKKLNTRFPDGTAVRNATISYSITYLSDSLRVTGYLVVPKKPGRYPCLIYNRGGNREFGALGEQDYGYLMAKMASWGYIVVGSQYRGNSGSEGQEEFGGKDLHDVLNLIPLLSHVPKADTSRIGMFGVSRGGMMTYLAMKETCRLKAAIILSGLVDLVKLLDTRPDFDSLVYGQLIPGYFANKTAALQERSAFYFADKICKTTPLLILHGTSDWRVPTDQVMQFVNKLYELKQPFRFSLFEGGAHGLYEHYNEVSRQMKAFADRYIRDEQSWPSMELHGR